MRRTRCVDCLAAGSVSTRAAPKPGPRCLEHWYPEKRRRSAARHAEHIELIYQITGDMYQAVLIAQKGKCFICQRATGKARRLAIDHDHDLCDDHPPERACPKCFRALLCGPCNKDVLGRLDVAALRRAIKVLTDRPAQKILLGLGQVKR